MNFKKRNKKKIKKNMISIEQPELDNVLKSKGHSKFNYREGYGNLTQINKSLENKKDILIQDYNTTLSDWEKAYKEKKMQGVNTTGNFSSRHTIFKVKDDSTNSKYYVDNNGYKRKFANDAAWGTKDITCPNRVQHTITEEESQKLRNGSLLYGYIPCRGGGYNIEYENRHAFITEKGETRMYEDFLGSDASCKNKQLLKLDNLENGKMMWDNYSLNLGAQIKNTESGNDCKIQDGMGDNLTHQNNKLKIIANNMKKDINSMIEKRKALEKKIGGKFEQFTLREGLDATYKCNDGDTSEKCKMLKNIDEYNKVKNRINKIRGDISTYDSKIEQANLSVSSIQMHHLIWMILGGTFVLTAIINS